MPISIHRTTAPKAVRCGSPKFFALVALRAYYTNAKNFAWVRPLCDIFDFDTYIMNSIILTANNFCKGIYDINTSPELWIKTFNYIISHKNRFHFDKHKIHLLWTVNGGNLRRKISNDNLVLSVLILSLPGYNGPGLTLFRGESKHLYESNNIGFSWTPKIEVASIFASGLNSIESGGVLLKAFAPTNAILSSPNAHSMNQMYEHEFTCNPNLLENIEVLSIFPKTD